MKADHLAALRAALIPLDESNIKLKILLYGGSGVGKTVEALLLAQKLKKPGEKILYIDTGEGWVSLMNHPELKKDVVRMVFESYQSFRAVVQAMQEKAEGFENFSSVVFDEFSTSAKKDQLTVNKKTLGDNTGFAAPEFKQFNIASNRGMDVFLNSILELKETHHLIFCAHQRQDEDRVTGVRRWSPSFMAKFGETIKENVHVVGRITADVTNNSGTPTYKREIQVHPTKMVDAKSRVGGLAIKEPLSKFNQVLLDFIAEGGKEVDEQEVVELEDEKQIEGDFSDQMEFAGFEVEDKE